MFGRIHGASPSGKAPDFGSGIRRFESLPPQPTRSASRRIAQCGARGRHHPCDGAADQARSADGWAPRAPPARLTRNRAARRPRWRVRRACPTAARRRAGRAPRGRRQRRERRHPLGRGARWRAAAAGMTSSETIRRMPTIFMPIATASAITSTKPTARPTSDPFGLRQLLVKGDAQQRRPEPAAAPQRHGAAAQIQSRSPSSPRARRRTGTPSDRPAAYSIKLSTTRPSASATWARMPRMVSWRAPR